MQFLKNKHLILAMFVAPALAVIAYFAVDHFVSETPHAAVQGNSYKLAAKSNCRYKSGLCTLKNGDIEVVLKAEVLANNQIEILLNSDRPVQNVIVSLVSDNEATEPKMMTAAAVTANGWRATLNKLDTDHMSLRLALIISNTLYYAETSTVFIDYETTFSRENFSN